MAFVVALIPWLALAPWMTRFGVGRTASGQIYGLWPGDLARPRARCCPLPNGFLALSSLSWFCHAEAQGEA